MSAKSTKTTRTRTAKAKKEPDVGAPEAVEEKPGAVVEEPAEESVEEIVEEEDEKKPASEENNGVFQCIATAKPGDVLVVSMTMKLAAAELANVATKLRAEARRAGVSVVLLPFNAGVKVESKAKGK